MVKLDLFLVGDAVHHDAYRVPAMLSAYAETAEAAGFDTVWLAEHHFIRYGGCPSVPTLAGYLLARTTRLNIGAAACVLSNRNPVALAEETVLLDGLSPGRFRLGVARGGPRVDLEVFGTGLERFDRGFAESLDVMRRWTSGATMVDADGEFNTFRPVAVTASTGRPAPSSAASAATTSCRAATGPSRSASGAPARSTTPRNVGSGRTADSRPLSVGSATTRTPLREREHTASRDENGQRLSRPAYVVTRRTLSSAPFEVVT